MCVRLTMKTGNAVIIQHNKRAWCSTHTHTHRDKISRSLIIHFRRSNPNNPISTHLWHVLCVCTTLNFPQCTTQPADKDPVAYVCVCVCVWHMMTEWLTLSSCGKKRARKEKEVEKKPGQNEVGMWHRHHRTQLKQCDKFETHRNQRQPKKSLLGGRTRRVGGHAGTT